MNKKELEIVEELKCEIHSLQLENNELKKEMENKKYIISALRDQFSELQEKFYKERTINVSNSTVTIGK
jgi:predicted RNase H-like nuclease (RuvC/YqgF family)